MSRSERRRSLGSYDERLNERDDLDEVVVEVTIDIAVYGAVSRGTGVVVRREPGLGGDLHIHHVLLLLLLLL